MLIVIVETIIIYDGHIVVSKILADNVDPFVICLSIRMIDFNKKNLKKESWDIELSRDNIETIRLSLSPIRASQIYLRR